MKATYLLHKGQIGAYVIGQGAVVQFMSEPEYNPNDEPPKDSLIANS